MQKELSNVYPNFSIKSFSIIALSIIIFSVASFFAYPFLFNSSDKQEVQNIDDGKNLNKPSTNVLVPMFTDSDKQAFRGKIESEIIDSIKRYKLIIESSRSLYLESATLDLSLMDGLNVTVVGLYGKRQINGNDVFIVDSVEFQ